MRTVYAQASDRIFLGKQGENEAVRVIWQGIVKDYAKLHGEGVFTLAVRRHGDAAAYPAAVSARGGDVLWDIHAADVAKDGNGSCELTYTVGGVVAKTRTWDTYVLPSISADGSAEPPEDPAKAWFDEIRSQIGDLSKLTTKAKENLVAAINEAAQSGGSGGGGSVSMRVDGGYIQYSTDDGDTWESLIAVADLKGDPGAAGHTPEITASKSGKTTTIKADGTAIAEIQDGADGKDGTDGAPGKDGHTPQKGVDYWTASDKAGIVQDTLAALPTWTGGAY